ncbi:MAG TPA: DUF167 domain-containing protein [Verrucomicrobiae bacterium]|nr:DUF167 domain-containing protein [Verrucomicrobiae bacterium]
MSLPSCLRADERGTLLAIKAQPRASRNELAGFVGVELKVRVTAPPVDSAANEAIVELLADLLKCGRAAVQITRGPKNPHKTVLIAGLAPDEVARRLGLG